MPYQSTREDRKRALIIGVFYVVLAVALGYMLLKIWPPIPWPNPDINHQDISRAWVACGYGAPEPPATTDAGVVKGDIKRPVPPMPISLFFNRTCVMTSFDERLILLVIVAGMLGSFIHGATSLADYVGNDGFNRSWTWFYLLRPVIGMALALVFYFVIRGGFLTTNVGATDINPYGIAALAGLVGMFSKQATDKLSEVFSTLFKSGSGEGDEKRKDSLAPQPTTITVTLDQAEAVAGSGPVTLAVNGTGFVDGAVVFLNDAPLPTTFGSATSLSAEIAADAIATPGVLKLTVVNPDGTKSASTDFTVNAALTVASVNPPQVASGGPELMITVSGAGFVDGATVNLNDVAQPTAFQGTETLTADIAEATIAAPATLSLKVVNPDGTESTPVDFPVT